VVFSWYASDSIYLTSTSTALELLTLLAITLASGLAGFIDAIVGGGGLIMIPSLFTAFPSAPPASLLGTNKGASVWGTAFASWMYSKKVSLPLRSLLIAGGCAFVGSFVGAWCVTLVSPALFKAALPGVLLALLIYTLIKKELGQTHTPKFSINQEALRLAIIGALIGFYDGFFGPGTGSFFVFLLVRWLGFDFLHASAGAKILNTASNSAALILFSIQGYVWWHLAIPLALANVFGSFLGSRLAIRKGAGFVRYIFIFVVSMLIFKTGFDFVWPLIKNGLDFI